jgi:surfactin synthase thioesterase subunit
MGDPPATWWVVPAPRVAPRLRLFCFPYAGASATAYHRFSQRLPDDIEVCSLQLPGRGFRLREPGIATFSAILDAVAGAIEGRLDRPYALFGHSMGGLVAFELTRRLRAAGARLPLHLVVSASPPPQRVRPRALPLEAPIAELWAAVNDLYGTPEKKAADPQLLELAVPPLRDDLRAFASYRYASAAPLEVPITSLVGSADPMVREGDAEAWRAETSGPFALHVIPGPHLYVQDMPDALLVRVRDAIT